MSADSNGSDEGVSEDGTLETGVIGIGAMGKHHARVYEQLRGCELVGVADVDRQRAEEVATRHGTTAVESDELIDRADAVTVATPTSSHYELATACIDAGTNVLVEKPLAEESTQGRALVERAHEADVTLQVGHIERFNPVTQTLQNVVAGLDVIAMDARRLGPQPDRSISESVVTDLMVHDIDIVTTLLGQSGSSDVSLQSIDSVSASGNADGRHATAKLEIDDVVATLTASRVTQRKVRTLTVTAAECYVVVDYLGQDIEIHRNSASEYVVERGDAQYRHESVIESPAVGNGEPLKHELRGFLEAIREGTTPRVTGEDGVRALEIVTEINRTAFGTAHAAMEVSHD